mmetsp:Transcript_33990/g.69494  ORF Transcript_33990/g.69494 Transcript_33990/m.69494 type:complete len:206 (+) Transcript_33990:486-1103(+)
MPLGRAQAGAGCHAGATVQAYVRANRLAAVCALPVRRARTLVGPGAVAAVSAGLGAHGRRAVGVPPPVAAGASVGGRAHAPVQAGLDARGLAAVVAEVARGAPAQTRPHAERVGSRAAQPAVGSCAAWGGAVVAGPAVSAVTLVGANAGALVLADLGADRADGADAVVGGVGDEEHFSVGQSCVHEQTHALREVELCLLRRLPVG